MNIVWGRGANCPKLLRPFFSFKITSFFLIKVSVYGDPWINKYECQFSDTFWIWWLCFLSKEFFFQIILLYLGLNETFRKVSKIQMGKFLSGKPRQKNYLAQNFFHLGLSTEWKVATRPGFKSGPAIHGAPWDLFPNPWSPSYPYPSPPSARAPAVKLGQNPQLNVEIESCQQVLQQPAFLVKFPEYEFHSEFEQK